MKKKLRVSGIGRPRKTSVLTLEKVAENVKLGRSGSVREIDAMVADLREQMSGGGIAVQEAQIALLTAFPPASNSTARLAKNMKGRNTKR